MAQNEMFPDLDTTNDADEIRRRALELLMQLDANAAKAEPAVQPVAAPVQLRLPISAETGYPVAVLPDVTPPLMVMNEAVRKLALILNASFEVQGFRLARRADLAREIGVPQHRAGHAIDKMRKDGLIITQKRTTAGGNGMLPSAILPTAKFRPWFLSTIVAGD